MDTLSPLASDGNIPHKTCTGPCGRSLPATPEFFYRNKGRKDGLLPMCKQCRSTRDKVYYDAHVEQKRSRSKQYYYNHHETRSTYNAEYRNAHRENLRLYAAQYFTENHDACCEQQKQYYLDHHSEIRNYRAQFYQDNRDRILEERKAYYQTPQGRLVHQVGSRNRRSRKKNAPGTLTTQQIQAKLKSQNYCCYYSACGHAKFEKQNGKYVFHLEHTIPLSRSEHNPRHDVNYVVLACPSCNLSKKNKLPHEWPEGGRLL